MKRRYRNGFRPGIAPGIEEEYNPIEGVANLVDVMLVFACGLMLALIINWNVDVGGPGARISIEQGVELSEVEGFTNQEESPLQANVNYEEMGVVYRNPETGQLYMVMKDVEE